ncbi:MAG TPA: hypothetical protein VMV70_08870 [Gallionella sp.]|nr:hypothetical protein [Gallionella sp.]
MTKNIFVLIAALGMVFPFENAMAALTMHQRESVQDISWSVEILAFLAALVIAVIVWRLGKRDLKKRNLRNEKRRDITSD